MLDNGALRSQTKLISGKKINFVVVGSGPPLVLVHGWCNNWKGWMPIVPHLKDSFTLYIVDLLGFGDSDNLPEYTIQEEASYLAAFNRSLPERPISTVGLSMGSFVVAEAGFVHPDCTRSVCLAGPVLKNGRRDSLLGLLIRSILKGFDSFEPALNGLKRVIDTNTASYFTSKHLSMHRFNKTLIDLYGIEGKLKMRKEAFTQLGVSASYYDLEHVLVGYPLPALLIYGREDKVSKAAWARERVVPKNSLISVVEVPEAGHVVSFEKPGETARAIVEFVGHLKEKVQPATEVLVDYDTMGL